MKDSYSYKNAFFISLIYFIFGVIWIALSDNIVANIVANREELTLLQNYKGWFFIVFTTVLLFILTSRFFKSSFLQYQKQMELEKKHQKELSKHDTLIRTIIDNSPDAIYVKNTQGKYMMFNNGASSIVGVPKEKVIGNTDSYIFTDEVASKIKQVDKKILSMKIVQTHEEQIKTKFGVKKDFLVTKGPLFTNDGEVFGLFGISRDITQQKEYEQFLIDSEKEQYVLAHEDRLTKLPNRLHLTEYLHKKYKEKKAFSLILLGLDGFKVINDSYGHRFGDNLIISVVEVLKNTFDKASFIARIGGDEFAIVLDSDDKEYIESLMAKLKQKFNTPFSIHETDVYITASLGIAVCKENQKSLDNLLQQADAAMYNAKKMGKNTYSFYDEKFIQEALNHTQIATNLKKALQDDELELYYQSQNDPFTGKVIGIEALLRWKSQEGMISPGVFIPIAEETGLIIEIGNIVLKQGCKAAALWHKKGILNGKVAINISPKQLSHPDFLDNLDKIIKQTSCSPEWIELEITESSLMESPSQVILLLHQIKKRGFSISLDDFGTGYSSLSYIKDLPFDKLKIDQAFIRNIKSDSKNQTIVKSTISLAKGLSVVVLAEGVETLDELDFLKAEKIDFIQGYYYTQPMPLDQMGKLLILE
jgi:diguanylate cyclase (GGDEF)-like protein/PAS domain S-box-containing protein